MDLHYIENLQIDGAGVQDEDFANYFGTFTSTSLNSRNFSLSPETMADIVKQANAGVELRKDHSLWQDAIGTFISAYVYKGEGKGNFRIRKDLEGPKSNDVIKMIDAEIMKSMSIGFAHTDKTKVMCDTCAKLGDDNSQMKPKFTWYSYYFECDEGHILGQKSKVNKKEVLNTATYKGTVKLREISVVGTGADKNAKIVKKLKEELQAGNLGLEELPYFSESLNINLSQFNQMLGLDPTKTYSIPTNLNPKGDEPVSNPLQAVVDELNKTIATQNDKITNLEEQLEARPTQEQFDEVSEELETKTSQLAVKEQEIETQKAEFEKLAQDGKDARELERQRGHTYLKEYYGDGYKEDPEAATHVRNLDNPDSNIETLRSLADGFRSMAVSKRPAGRKSSVETGYTGKKVKSGENFKFKQTANRGVA